VVYSVIRNGRHHHKSEALPSSYYYLMIKYIKIRYFLRITEDDEKILNTLESFLGIKLNPSYQEVEGLHGNKFKIVEINIEGKKLENLVKKILNSLDELDKKEIMENTESFIDRGVFYLSIDKQEFLKGNLILGGRDRIQFAIRLIAYPAKMENYVKIVKELLN
jgi:RNA binding exosome subunit